MAQLPAPSFWLVRVINMTLDFLIKGLGVQATITASIAAEPWLAWPGVHWLFVQFVNAIADFVDSNAQKMADILAIRLTNDAKKAVYDAALAPIKQKGGGTPDEIKAASNAIDRLIHRGD